MMIPSRRSVLRAIKVAGGVGFLSPLVQRLTSEAYGQAPVRRNLVVLTDGNGWGHQGMSRTGDILETGFRSASDWDLPEVLAPLAPVRKRVTICRTLYNPHDQNLHGSGWATLSVQNGDGANPGGISVDRRVALGAGSKDPFPSIALGTALRKDRPPSCTSADGARKPFPAIGSPLVAFAQLFGSTGAGEAEAAARLQQERSLLDGLMADVNRTRGALAGSERLKLDQLLDSYRGLERQIIEREAIFSRRKPPPGPKPSSDKLGLVPETIRAHVEIIAQALAFGLTHVAHLSLLGFDAHNAGWGALGYGGDAHENLSHVSGYTRERATEAVSAIARFKATELAFLMQRLQEVAAGDATLSDRTVVLWVNSGGGKHHDGYNTIPVVLIADATGSLRGGQYLKLPGSKHCISELFLSVVRSAGVETDTFGDPRHCPGPLPGLS